MISDLEELKKKLGDDAAGEGFALDPRTAAALLESINRYTALIPFASNDSANWSEFWLNSSTSQALAAIYQNPALAQKMLPVQQTFLLALLQLLETPTLLLNTLPARHRSLYYRDLLGFAPRASQPDKVAISFTLLSNTEAYLLPAGTALDAGQDTAGNRLSYLTDNSLLITPQQLGQIRWIRPRDGSSDLEVCTVLDQANNISLPEEGSRLFTATENAEALTLTTSLSLPLLALTGDIAITAAVDADNTRDIAASRLISPAGNHSFRQTRDKDRVVYRLLADDAQKVRKNMTSTETPQLSLSFPAGENAWVPDALTASIDNCEQIGYRAENGAGHLTAFSYPFGLQPVAGSAFELTLPVEFARTGGVLTLQPQWRDLPAQSFARWYADYPDAPADNTAFQVQIVLIAPDGSELTGEAQPLFTGDGVPQALPLSVTLPADSLADVGYRVRVMLSGVDFYHAAWQADPAGKNPPWTPQVSRIETRFQYALAQPQLAVSASGLQVTAENLQALYLGFSGVTPGETLSLYWSLTAPSGLELTWAYYNQQGNWISLDAFVDDSTGGLAGSGLWQTVLPEDAAVGSNYSNFSPDYYWVRAETSTGAVVAPADVPKLQAVFAGAVTATLDTSDDIDASHFTQALPADTIRQLATPVAEISGVSQPLASSGGRAEETEAEMRQRAATRIAHRKRAISWGNMRSMLMDQYPQLYDVQFPDAEKLNHIPALEVQQLLAIPDSRQSDNDDPLRPTLSSARLKAMSDWLAQYTSLWAQPELVNPVYVDVTARYTVLFNTGISPDYGYSQLAAWLQQRYMPWGDDLRQAVTPGNRVDYYALLAAIQQSPLVQRVTALTLMREGGEAGQASIVAGDNEVLILIPQADTE